MCEDYETPLQLRRNRRGAVERLAFWRRAFFNLEAALEQAAWCAEAWPHAFVAVDQLPPGARVPPALWTHVASFATHTWPRMVCGCWRSLPPCSLAHAVAVSQ
jgi:hypothetical protein